MTENLANQINLIEAVLFTRPNPITSDELKSYLTADVDFDKVMNELVLRYKDKGIEVRSTIRGWIFTTSSAITPQLRDIVPQKKKLSRSSLETLAVIAWHQPITRSEIEKIRGVSLSGYIIKNLLETGWVTAGNRRKTAGRPLEWKTTETFLDYFNLESLANLPTKDELTKSGFYKIFTNTGQIGSLNFDDEDYEDLVEKKEINKQNQIDNNQENNTEEPD